MSPSVWRLGAQVFLLGGALTAQSAQAQDGQYAGFEFGVPVQNPFVCENDAHGVDLLPITGAPCQADPVVDYVYRNADGAWQPFDPAGPRPTDIAETTTNEGVLTPLIARREFGKTPNGSTYVIGMLHDPATDAPTPNSRSAAWNGRLIMAYGGGVQANYHSGRGCGLRSRDNLAFLGDGPGQGYQDIFMERGYATACGSLIVMGTNNDDVKSAETTAQIKGRFAELYGEPDFTIGIGASGGSMQQLLIANNYPGLLDGIMPKRNYPDGISFLQPLHDCELLVHSLDHSEVYYTETQRTAISGYATFDYCRRNGARYPNMRPTNCDASVKDELTFNPDIKGVRCTYQDNLAYIYGVQEAAGALDALGNPSPTAARNFYDNVGVQYGLKALQDGAISFDQFIYLNQHVGGFDINGGVVSARSSGDEQAIRAAYETGRLNAMGAGLAELPIIDVRRWRDIPQSTANPTDLDVHDASHSRTVRERLIAANGSADNHVIITAADSPGRGPGTPIAAALSRALAQMDEWLINIAKDPRDIPMSQKVAENRPEDLVDSCYVNAELKISDAEQCSRLFPYAGHPRIAAGGPLTEDLIKCQLKPVDAAEYGMTLTAAQRGALQSTFPQGVCDYSRPGVAQVPLAGTWLSYSGGGNFTVHASAQ